MCVHLCVCVWGGHFSGTAADGGWWRTNHPGTDLPYEADNIRMLLTVLNTCFWQKCRKLFEHRLAFLQSYFEGFHCLALSGKKEQQRNNISLWITFYTATRDFFSHQMDQICDKSDTNISTSLPPINYCTTVLKECTHISLNIFVPFLSDWDRVRINAQLIRGLLYGLLYMIFFFFGDIIFCSKYGRCTKLRQHEHPRYVQSDYWGQPPCFAHSQSWTSNTTLCRGRVCWAGSRNRLEMSIVKK